MSQRFLIDPPMPIATAASPRIVLVEDDPVDLEKIRVELAKFDLEKLDDVTRYRELVELLGREEYDVVSIDWELHGVEKGGDILQLLVRSYPEVARVVFTQHTKRFQEAMSLGADACIFKRVDGDLTEYTEVMKKAARVGFARHIGERLNKLGQADLPSLPVGSIELDEQMERALYDKARQVALQYQADGKDDGGLRELLIRRGWW